MDYIVRRYERADEAGVLNVLRLALPFGEWETPALWRWKHFDNPFGHSIITVAEATDGTIVGVTGWMKWRLRLGDDILTAGRPVDTATHPEFQRRRVFTRLTELAEQCAREDQVDLGISSPNDASLPGFLKQGWMQLDTHGKQLRLVRPFSAVSRVIGSVLGVQTKDWGAAPAGVVSIASLLESRGLERLLRPPRAPFDTLTTDRTESYLRWRYSGYRKRRYHAVLSFDDREVEAALIVRLETVRGMRSMSILELFALNQSAAGRVIDKAARSGTNLLRAHFQKSGDEFKMLARVKFRSDSSTPQNLITRPLVSTPENMQISFSLGDLEFL